MAFVPSLLKVSPNKRRELRMEFESLLKDKIQLDEFAESLASTYRNSKRLEKLVRDFLEVSRIENHRLEIHKEYFNINEKIRNVVKDIHNKTSAVYLQHENKNKSISLNFEPPCHDPITVFADKIRIYEVLSNLINNALKFSENEPVVISVKYGKESYPAKHDLNDSPEKIADKRTKDEKVIVSVRDRGKGIDREILPRLFTKFATKSDQGTGLGLYLAKSIVDAHGGQIWAQNNADGKGATFSFTLPLKRGED